MKNLIYLYVLLISMVSFAQERGFHSMNVTVGDINSDGWMDIVIANSDDFNLYYLNIFHKK